MKRSPQILAAGRVCAITSAMLVVGCGSDTASLGFEDAILRRCMRNPAACAGSTGHTITAASVSFADVSAAVASAARGDTVLVPAGSATWPSALVLTRGIMLRGAGRDATHLTRDGALVSIEPDLDAIANEEIIRVEDFTFDGDDTALTLVTVRGAGATADKPFRNLAIGDCRFADMGPTTSGSGAISLRGQTRGVIYGNVFDRCNVILECMGNDDLTEWSNGHFPFAYGSSDNLFFEDNVIEWSSAFDGQSPGWTQTGQGARLVFRYNHYDFTNTDPSEATEIHTAVGFQNWPGGGQTGTMIGEYYGNTVAAFGGYRWMAHQGSWLLMFGNHASGPGDPQIGMLQYGPRSGTAGSGSGCTADVPGAAGTFVPEVNNTYVFDNVGASIENMFPWIPDGCGVSGENVGYWNSQPAFDGTIGVGRGSMPPTGGCTPGVAYWVTSASAPTTDAAALQASTLYKCVSPNVWMPYYTPYVYPHPLR